VLNETAGKSGLGVIRTVGLGDSSISFGVDVKT
jgi:hypothetical protein